MFATIRHYTPKPTTVTQDSMERLRRQLQDDFLPIVQKVEGFHCYYAVNVGGKELLTIGVFDSQKGASESTRRAAEFVKTNKLPFDVGRPEIVEGEVLTSVEAGRMVGTH